MLHYFRQNHISSDLFYKETVHNQSDNRSRISVSEFATGRSLKALFGHKMDLALERTIKSKPFCAESLRAFMDKVSGLFYTVRHAFLRFEDRREETWEKGGAELFISSLPK